MQSDELLSRLAAAIERGDVRPAEVERLLEPRRAERPTAPAVLTVIGLAVAFAGVALLYALQFRDMSHAAQVVTPFLFPAVLIGAAVALALTGRPRWQAETVGMLGQVALAGAFAAVQDVLSPHNAAAYGAICAAVGIIEVLACHRAIGSVRMTGWGLSVSIVAFVNLAVVAAGDDSTGTDIVSLAVLVLAQALLAAGIAYLLWRRESEYAVHAARTAALLAYGAAAIGQGQQGFDSGFSAWHLVLTVAVVTTFLTAAALRLDPLVWVGALGGLLWLWMAAVVSHSHSGGAQIVVVAGFGLAGLGLLVAQVRKITHPVRRA